MNTPVPQDALVARLGDDLAGVAREVDRIRTTLLTLQSAPRPTAPAPAPLPAPPPPGPWGPPVAWAPPPPGWGPPSPPARPPRVPRPPRAPRAAWSPAKLLAVTGAATTVLGVVLLLVLAAGRGWFGPEARVIGGAVLGLALVGIGVRVRRRAGGADDPAPAPAVPTAAVALAATGVATLFLTVAAAVALFGLLPLALGAPFALAVTAGGLVLADHWRHQGLALGVLIAAGLAAPLVVGGPTPTLVALVLGAQVAAVLVARRRTWPAVATTAAVISTVAALGAAIRLLAGAPDTHLATTVAVLAVLVAGGVSAILLGASGRVTATAVLGAPVLPVLLVSIGLARVPGTLVAGGVAVALLLAVVALDRATAGTPEAGHRALALVAGAGATGALLVATVLAMGSGPLSLPLLAEALVLGVAAAVTRRAGPLLAAAVLGAVGGLVALGLDAPMELVASFPARPFVVTLPGGAVTAGAVGELAAALVVYLLLSAVALVGLVALGRLGWLRDRGRAATAAGLLGVVALYGAAGAVVTTALLVSPTRDAFLVGHVLVTVSWTAIALVLLARGLKDSLSRVLGGVLVIAAVVKLVTFDLTALDGLARVAAFLGAGLVLLAAGSRYAKAVAAAPGASGADGASAGPGPAGSSEVGPPAGGGRRPEA
ncbi:DUF2339 domain-containing protein [Actinomycetospora sp. NBC_00405]|uniref:DUF2339 domain-containing protein n=1 Tax=Actinomycetospora sp. NBC_00405 TaxID=2975952 RepID=UPI002E1DADC2